MIDVIMFCLIVFSISSMWLYSPGSERLRNWWINSTGVFSPLGYCQLCCAFWISIILYLSLFKFYFIDMVICSFIASGVSWLLGALTMFLLHGRALFEEAFKEYSK